MAKIRRLTQMVVVGEHTRHNTNVHIKNQQYRPVLGRIRSDASQSDYDWNNLVNRYVTLDPLNPFLFGTGQPFASNTTPFINP